MAREAHSIRSSEREEYLEYMFLGELCSYAWDSEQFIEVARSHTDAFGYDLILKANGFIRHVQLKASVAGGSTSQQTINVRLAEQPSGCVVWLIVEDDTLQTREYGWFGAAPGEALPSLGKKAGKHTKGDAKGEKKVRSSTRVLNKGQFQWLYSKEEMFEQLFGQTKEQ